MKDFSGFIEQSDKEIRAGSARGVAKRLLKINVARIPRPWRLPLAQLCRRAGLPTLGLKILSRVVLSPHHQTSATHFEAAEYAVLLMRHGARLEAVKRLDAIDVFDVPDVLLYQAFARFMAWEFHEAVPFLERYIRAMTNPYARLVGKTNLAFALVECGDYGPAFDVLEEVLARARESHHRQMESNALALLGQVSLQRQDFAQARAHFLQAGALSEKAQTNDQFFTLKWLLISEGLEKRSEAPFDELRHLAVKHREWGARREADLHSLKVNFERERFLHLYFGSPFPAFRRRITSELVQEPPRVYVLGSQPAPCLDLGTGLIDGESSLNPGRKGHQLIDALLRDFYQPVRLAALFSALFPGEAFNISSSPDRVHQILRRTRAWIRKQDLAFSIVEDDGWYSLSLDGDFSFRVPLERELPEPRLLHFAKLRSLFGSYQGFSARDAQTKLGLAPATVHALLHWALFEGRLRKADQVGRTTMFRVAG